MWAGRLQSRSIFFNRMGFLHHAYCAAIADPIYDYDPTTDSVQLALDNPKCITVMAVDNLPCELPRSASEEFGRDLIDRILPCLFIDDPEKIIERGTIAANGKLTSHFEYLSDYIV